MLNKDKILLFFLKDKLNVCSSIFLIDDYFEAVREFNHKFLINIPMFHSYKYKAIFLK